MDRKRVIPTWTLLRSKRPEGLIVLDNTGIKETYGPTWVGSETHTQRKDSKPINIDAHSAAPFGREQ